jgi:hypothetical protein
MPYIYYDIAQAETYNSLYSKSVMMLRESMITDWADGAKHAATNFASRRMC